MHNRPNRVPYKKSENDFQEDEIEVINHPPRRCDISVRPRVGIFDCVKKTNNDEIEEKKSCCKLL